MLQKSRHEVFFFVQNKQIIAELIRQELALHPNARLLDIFKIFYQSAFGPGHIISDENSAKKYLKAELEAIQKYEDFQLQNISWKNDYYRVNLSVIIDEFISFEDYFRAFINSAVPLNKLSWNDWIWEWKQIGKYLKKNGYNLFQQKEDEIRISEILEKKITAFSHSKTYKDFYDPHYRVISRKEVEKIGLENL